MAKAALVARASKDLLHHQFELKKAADMHGFITVAEAT